MTTQLINLDHASSAPILPEVKQAMLAALERWGNPSSIHQEGRRAKAVLQQAREQVALLINAKPEEVYFTSCGTESNNWALRGLFQANCRKGSHVVISAIEHPSVSLAARRLELEGAVVSFVPVDREGLIAPSALKAALRPDTVLVSIMMANGEVGTLEPIRELAAIAHEQGILFHTDAIAAAGFIPIDVCTLRIDALSLSANPLGGAVGAAALFIREGVRILPLLEGGGQEQGGRSGTEALPTIVGMGVAAELAKETLPQRTERLNRLRNLLRDGLVDRMERLHLNGSWSARLPHNLHVCIEGVSSESLVLGLDQAGIAVGLGSACNSKAMRPSSVLKAMGLSEEQAKGALVLTVGVPTTEEDVHSAIEVIPIVIERLRHLTALTTRKN